LVKSDFRKIIIRKKEGTVPIADGIRIKITKISNFESKYSDLINFRGALIMNDHVKLQIFSSFQHIFKDIYSFLDNLRCLESPLCDIKTMQNESTYEEQSSDWFFPWVPNSKRRVSLWNKLPQLLECNYAIHIIRWVEQSHRLDICSFA